MTVMVGIFANTVSARLRDDGMSASATERATLLAMANGEWHDKRRYIVYDRSTGSFVLIFR